MLSDEQLMVRVGRGSRDALEELFERYRDPLWRFLTRRVDGTARAEELHQDVFLALLQAAPKYEPRSSFRSYFFGIAYNILLAARRKDRQRAADPLSDEHAVTTPDPDAALWVRRALESLEPDQREIVMLREYEQLTYQEIADVLGIPVNTVRSRLFRARMDLKSALYRHSEVHLKVSHGNH
jgi:RNA polymerase sigma-70 factor, ECF subfamily